MLQRVLAGLTSIEGVEQAMLVDDNGHLMACVGNEGETLRCDFQIYRIFVNFRSFLSHNH